ILHPDAYFAGEVPVLVPAPPPPDGTHAIATGRMGELGTRLALEACVEKDVLKDFIPLWAGDAYTIVEGPKNALSLLWTTAWSSEVAGNVSNVMKLVQPCWQEQAAAGPNPLGWSIASPSRIADSAELVAVARGSIDLGAATARQLAARPVTRAPVPPLGDVPPSPSLEPTRVRAGHFVSPRLAL